MTKKSIFHYALSSLLVGGIALSVTSCADDDINPNQGNDGDALVRFSINDVQEQAVSRGLEMTRGAIANGITAADLAGHKLAAHSNRNIDVCLIETTVEGVNPIKADARTRANIETTIGGDFSSTGIRGVASTSILTTPEWSKLTINDMASADNAPSVEPLSALPLARTFRGTKLSIRLRFAMPL